MSGGWEDSDRRLRLPADWPERVNAVKKRAGGRCEWRLPSGKRCPRRGSECDHRRPGDDHSLRNLQLLCGFHHGKKSAQEGNQAKRAARNSRKRTAEQHPGVVR